MAEVRWGRIGIVSVSLLGLAIIFFLIGKSGIETVNAPDQTTGQVISKKTDAKQPQGNAADARTYKNATYGFGAIFLSQAEAATECSLDAKLAYDPIKEYVFADQPIECAPADVKDSDAFYNERGGQLETMVFDLTKCHDATKDQIEERFCAKYDVKGVTNGVSTGKWPKGTWTKSGDFITFYVDLTLGKNEHWKSDYKFLVLER